MELISTLTIKFQARVAEKETSVETLIDIAILILNEMVAAIDEMTPQSDLEYIYQSIDDYIRGNKEPENLPLQNLLEKLWEKIKDYGKIQKTNRMEILANFLKFCLRMSRKYGAQVKFSKSSILLHVTCSSKQGYDLYKKDLENGQIGAMLMELFLFPPFLGSFDLKEGDIEITLNGRLLTQRHGKMNICQAFVSYDVHCTNILVVILFIGILYFLILCTLELAVCIVNVYIEIIAFVHVCVKKNKNYTQWKILPYR